MIPGLVEFVPRILERLTDRRQVLVTTLEQGIDSHSRSPARHRPARIAAFIAGAIVRSLRPQALARHWVPRPGEASPSVPHPPDETCQRIAAAIGVEAIERAIDSIGRPLIAISGGALTLLADSPGDRIVIRSPMIRFL